MDRSRYFYALNLILNMKFRFLLTFSALVTITILSFSFGSCSKKNPPPVIVKDTTIIDTTIITISDTTIHLDRGLVLRYQFNNNLADSSGNHHDGVGFGNITYAPDRSNTPNTAVSFDGSSYIKVPDDGKLSPANLTVALQLYVDVITAETIFAKANYDNSNSISWSAAFANGGGDPYPNSPRFGVRGPDVACGQFDPMSNSDLVYSMVDVQTKKWYHLTCVFENGVEKLYLNGILRNAFTRTFTSAKQCTEASLMIGGFWKNNLLGFQGKMDDFRLYDRALNDHEIAQLGKGF